MSFKAKARPMHFVQGQGKAKAFGPRRRPRKLPQSQGMAFQKKPQGKAFQNVPRGSLELGIKVKDYIIAVSATSLLFGWTPAVQGSRWEQHAAVTTLVIKDGYWVIDKAPRHLLRLPSSPAPFQYLPQRIRREEEERERVGQVRHKSVSLKFSHLRGGLLQGHSPYRLDSSAPQSSQVDLPTWHVQHVEHIRNYNDPLTQTRLYM